MSFKTRLRELGTIPLRLYESASMQNNNNELLEIGNKGNFIPSPDLTRKCDHVKRVSDGTICSNIN